MGCPKAQGSEEFCNSEFSCFSCLLRTRSRTKSPVSHHNSAAWMLGGDLEVVRLLEISLAYAACAAVLWTEDSETAFPQEIVSNMPAPIPCLETSLSSRVLTARFAIAPSAVETRKDGTLKRLMAFTWPQDLALQWTTSRALQVCFLRGPRAGSGKVLGGYARSTLTSMLIHWGYDARRYNIVAWALLMLGFALMRSLAASFC